MFCVVQETRLKRPNKCGAYKELRAYQNQWTVGDKPKSWGWEYAGERFERPHMEAYKISLHQSFRENGVPRKKQFSVATIGYYGLIDFGLYDHVSGKLEEIAKKTGIAFEALYGLVEEKLTPLADKIMLEFRETEEYEVQKRHEAILESYRTAKTAFGKRYGVDSHEYDYCFDIFGDLKNREYFEQLAKSQHQRQEYQRSYCGGNSSNHSGRSNSYNGSYRAASSGTYTDDERAMLKQFYRALSRQFHPDMTGGKTEAEMKLLNRLAEDWHLK